VQTLKGWGASATPPTCLCLGCKPAVTDSAHTQSVAHLSIHLSGGQILCSYQARATRYNLCITYICINYIRFSRLHPPNQGSLAGCEPPETFEPRTHNLRGWINPDLLGLKGASSEPLTISTELFVNTFAELQPTMAFTLPVCILLVVGGTIYGP